MRITTISRLLLAATLLCSHGAWAFHTIPCSDATIQDAVKSILADEAKFGAANVDYYIALAGGQVYNEPIVINDNGTSGGIVLAISGGHPADADGCAASGDFDGSETVMSGGGRFHQSVVQITGHATVYLHRLTLAGAQLSGSGGGISFDGSGSLNLFGDTIAENTAGSGAGIHFNGNNSDGLALNFHNFEPTPGLVFVNVIRGNFASSGSGGGIDLSGNTTLNNDGLLIIESNSASGDGGGINVNGVTQLSNTGNLIIGPYTLFDSGNVAGGNGGGIAMHGQGNLQLGSNVQILGNFASNGGGIYADNASDITFQDNAVIGGNTAANQGGGIYLINFADLLASSSAVPTQVFGNKVTDSSGCGGGIFVGGRSSMTFSGSITNNTSAGDGGGICGMSGTSDSGDDHVTITLAGRSTAKPATVSGNSAGNRGGGIFCRAYDNGGLIGTDIFENCYINANLFAIDGNSAITGTAIYGKAESNGSAAHDNGPDIHFGPTQNLSGLCNGRAGCNEISGNFQNGGTSADGSTIVLEKWGILEFHNTKLQHNQGAHLVDMIDHVHVYMTNTLVSDNSMNDILLFTSGLNNSAEVTDTTFAHDSFAANGGAIATQSITLQNDIFVEPGDAIYTTAVVTQDVADVMTNALDNSLDGGTTILKQQPLFVDAAHGDYHLAPFSPGIDVGANDATIKTDLDGNTRAIDELAVNNIDGFTDLGAYEFQAVLPPRPCSANDEIFCTEFE